MNLQICVALSTKLIWWCMLHTVYVRRVTGHKSDAMTCVKKSAGCTNKPSPQSTPENRFTKLISRCKRLFDEAKSEINYTAQSRNFACSRLSCCLCSYATGWAAAPAKSVARAVSQTEREQF